MKSKYAELFTAKLNDMDLVLFEKHREWESWTVDKQSDKCFMVSDNFEYFLCLPQHKEACLYYLNGGEVLVKSNLVPSWAAVTHGQLWGGAIGWMREDAQYRIKPKKEKRWIGIHPLGTTTPLGKTEKFVSDIVLHQLISVDMPFCEWQFIEIEVEV